MSPALCLCDLRRDDQNKSFIKEEISLLTLKYMLFSGAVILKQSLIPFFSRDESGFSKQI